MILPIIAIYDLSPSKSYYQCHRYTPLSFDGFSYVYNQLLSMMFQIPYLNFNFDVLL